MPTCVQKKRGNKQHTKKIMENVGYLQCYVSFRIHKCSMYLKKILDCHEMRHLKESFIGGRTLMMYDLKVKQSEILAVSLKFWT